MRTRSYHAVGGNRPMLRLHALSLPSEAQLERRLSSIRLSPIRRFKEARETRVHPSRDRRGVSEEVSVASCGVRKGAEGAARPLPSPRSGAAQQRKKSRNDRVPGGV